MAPEPPPSEVHPWLKTLPLAPEYHPTLAEFQDPIAYILKIEKEASQFGICKIVPPVPPAAKKIAVANLNRSFAARSPTKSPTFATRHQHVGFCPRKPRPMQKPVWQSGEEYTLQQFEAKAKQFDKAQLKRASKKHLSPLETETLFWRACADKPFTVEYANDIPGSGFAPMSVTGKSWREEEPGNVGESAWNMRGVSRAKGSLLRFMKEDIAGVTSPMVYVAMLFSWFAWHVEDHDLHSMNYLHLGAGKTWYGVPRDAGLAFEDVVRVHGYCGEVNPLVTFAILGEKTTVMSPEVLIGAGIPCCRLVQNAGEFVVTFPGAYHSGFSHGFNCGEAANIATPEWLKIAKAAAIRRASTNYPPMVSHFQLLYALALSLCSRVPISISNEPRSSRLKHKMKGEGEAMIKSMFVENVIQNNDLLGILLDKGSSCVVLPHNASSSPLFSGPVTKSKMTAKPRLSLGLSSHEEAVEASEVSFSDDLMLERKGGIKHFSGFCPRRASSVSVCEEKKPNSVKNCRFGSANVCSTSAVNNVEGENDDKLHGDGLLDQGLLSCVMCGILSFACVAVIQPREATARYLMSADCSFLKDQIVNAGEITNVSNKKEHNTQLVTASEQTESEIQDIMDDNLVDCDIQSIKAINQNVELISDTTTQKDVTALDLLASAYGYSSDSEEETYCEKSVCKEEYDLRDFLTSWRPKQQSHAAISSENLCSRKASSNGTDRGTFSQREASGMSRNSAILVSGSAANNQLSTLIDAAANLHALTGFGTKERCRWKAEFSPGIQSGFPEMFISHDVGDRNMGISSSLTRSRGVTHFNDGDFEVLDSSCCSTEKVNMSRSDAKLSDILSGSEDKSIPLDSCCDKVPSTRNDATMLQHNRFDTSTKNLSLSVMQTSDRDSSRMHIFCLEHALEIEKQLHPIGGVDIMLLCHPEYPKIEAEARTLANDLGIDHLWKDIPYKEASKEDQQRIRSALEDEEAIPMNSDWAVKLGINLYYSVSLSKTSIYSKQLPYNAVIYKSFVHNSAVSSPVKPNVRGKRSGRQKKLVVSGRWCGKVWMSNQVHPYLAHRGNQDREHVDSQDEQGYGQKSLVQSDTEHDDFIDSPKRPDTNTSAARKPGKRSKKPLQKLNCKKPRTESGNSDSIQDEAENSSAQGGRVLRSSNSKKAATPSRNKTTTQHNQNSRDEEAEETSCLRLRKQKSKYKDVKVKPAPRKQIVNKSTKKTQADYEAEDDDTEYPCNLEGCTMSFGSKHDLVLHKRNICPVKGCGKKFFSHKYLVQHRKVHVDDRPLKCPWKGCKMTFKWPWARTEHIRVHTGDRPYICGEAGCGQTFRFVSDFSRHKRKTGHSVKKNRR